MKHAERQPQDDARQTDSDPGYLHVRRDYGGSRCRTSMLESGCWYIILSDKGGTGREHSDVVASMSIWEQVHDVQCIYAIR